MVRAGLFGPGTLGGDPSTTRLFEGGSGEGDARSSGLSGRVVELPVPVWGLGWAVAAGWAVATGWADAEVQLVLHGNKCADRV